MYVSDCLERLLDASATRELVRGECIRIIEDLPDRITSQLFPVAEYVGGKCMGYPAVWFVERALSIPQPELRRVLRKASTSLMVSLSTSLADDFLDRNEAVGGNHLMVLYLLLLHPLTREQPLPSKLLAFLQTEIADAMDLFVGPPMPFPFLATGVSESMLGDMTRSRGKRIGNFHRMIAFELLTEMGIEDAVCEAIVRDAGKLGDWCAFLDDALDLEQDIEEGQISSFPVYALLALHPGVRQLLLEKQLTALAPVLASQELSAMILQHLSGLLHDIEIGTRQYAPPLAATFANLRHSLAGELPSLREQAHAEYMAKHLAARDPGPRDRARQASSIF